MRRVQETKSVEPGDWLDMGKGKVVVKGGSQSLRGKQVLLPWEPENNSGVNLGQKDDSHLDLLHLCCI